MIFFVQVAAAIESVSFECPKGEYNSHRQNHLLSIQKPQNYFQWVTNEKASDEIVDIGNDTTLVAILLHLTMAMTMPIEVTTAPIVMTESIVSTVMVMTLLF